MRFYQERARAVERDLWIEKERIRINGENEKEMREDEERNHVKREKEREWIEGENKMKRERK